MLSKSIGANIKLFRTEKGFSQDDLATKLFVTRQTVSNYETGKSFPDIDTLNAIAKELDVELNWILYGKPLSTRKVENRRTTFILVSTFVVLFVITLLLEVYTRELRFEKMNIMPNVLIRLILVPFCSILAGAVILQIIDYLLGITKPKRIPKKVGQITTICILGINLVVVLPYIIWCLSVVVQRILMDGNVTAYFPNIPIYQDVAMFFLTLMYKVPFVYSIFGMALWLFYPQKRDSLSKKM